MLAVALLAFACQKGDEDATTIIPCTGDCLFTVSNVEGVMVRMDCFDRYGIQLDNPSTGDVDIQFIYGIPDELPSRFEVQGKEVIFSAAFRPNSLTPLFPDPSFDMQSLYQIKLEKIRERN